MYFPSVVAASVRGRLSHLILCWSWCMAVSRCCSVALGVVSTRYQSRPGRRCDQTYNVSAFVSCWPYWRRQLATRQGTM